MLDEHMNLFHLLQNSLLVVKQQVNDASCPKFHNCRITVDWSNIAFNLNGGNLKKSQTCWPTLVYGRMILCSELQYPYWSKSLKTTNSFDIHYLNNVIITFLSHFLFHACGYWNPTYHFERCILFVISVFFVLIQAVSWSVKHIHWRKINILPIFWP